MCEARHGRGNAATLLVDGGAIVYLTRAKRIG